MKTRILILSAAVILAASCVKDIDPVENNGPVSEPAVLVPMEFTASVDTKAHLDNDFETVLWDDEEAICVFDNLGGDVEFTATKGGATTSFFGNVTEGATEFYALYPYRNGAKYDSETGSIASKLFPDQYAVKGSYARGDGGAVMVAKADENKVLSFKNVTSHIQFTLAEDITDVKSITLMGNKSEALCGTYSILWNNGEPTVEITDPITYVTLRNEDGSNLEPGAYFFTVLPVDFTAGFTVILSKEDKTQVAKRTDNPISKLSKRNQILPMATLAKKDYSDHMNYFVQYNEGHDITIGGYTFSKTTHPGGVLVNDTMGNTSFKNAGLYFVEPTGSGASFSGNPNVKDFMIVGTEEGRRSTLAFSKAIRPLTEGKILMLANLDCNITASNVITHHSSNYFTSYGKMVFSNCHVRNIPNKHFMNFSEVDWTMESITIENSEFGFAANASLLNSTKTATIHTMKVHNSIFYVSPDKSVTAFKLMNCSSGLTATNLDFAANTFDNILIETNIINIYKVASAVNFSRNLFVGCSAASDVKLLKFGNTTVPADITGTITNNYAFTTGTGKIGNGIGATGGYTNMTINSVATLASTPFSTTWNPASETYGAYLYPEGVSKTVGAKRDDMKTPSTDDPAVAYTYADLGTI